MFTYTPFSAQKIDAKSNVLTRRKKLILASSKALQETSKRGYSLQCKQTLCLHFEILYDKI